MTSISRWSCLTTCSMTHSSPWSDSVIRDTDGSSVSATDRLSMLYPLAAISEAILARTP